MEKYFDRHEAGKILSEHLKQFAKKPDVILLALPRGGVPIAFEIAKALSLPFDVFIVRKLGVPGHEELAMGAIATGDVIVFNEEILREFAVSEDMTNRVIQSEQAELNRREAAWRPKKSTLSLSGKTIILVDDGIATGATMRAAIQALRQYHPAKLIVAVPVAAPSTCEEMARLADEIICPLKPDAFYAVGAWYENFPQTSDEEVTALLQKR